MPFLRWVRWSAFALFKNFFVQIDGKDHQPICTLSADNETLSLFFNGTQTIDNNNNITLTLRITAGDATNYTGVFVADKKDANTMKSATLTMEPGELASALYWELGIFCSCRTNYCGTEDDCEAEKKGEKKPNWNANNAFYYYYYYTGSNHCSSKKRSTYHGRPSESLESESLNPMIQIPRIQNQNTKIENCRIQNPMIQNPGNTEF